MTDFSLCHFQQLYHFYHNYLQSQLIKDTESESSINQILSPFSMEICQQFAQVSKIQSETLPKQVQQNQQETWGVVSRQKVEILQCKDTSVGVAGITRALN